MVLMIQQMTYNRCIVFGVFNDGKVSKDPSSAESDVLTLAVDLRQVLLIMLIMC